MSPVLFLTTIFILSAVAAAISSSAWWQSHCQHKDKKLDLSGELNVPSVSTILLIFHQSCGSGSEPWSYYSLRATSSSWQAWELQRKFAMHQSCDGSLVRLGNLTRKSSSWFAEIESKHTNWKRGFVTCSQHYRFLREHQQRVGPSSKNKKIKNVFFSRTEIGNRQGNLAKWKANLELGLHLQSLLRPSCS